MEIYDNMAVMKSEDIKKLANLSRLELTNEELEKIPSEIENILGYVQNINKVVGNLESSIESAGTRNVTRPDFIENKDIDRNTLISSAPDSAGGYIKVKKILQN